MIVRHPAARSAHAVRRSAFTLMEVLVVVAILVILAGVGGVAYFSYLESANEQAAQLKIHTIEEAASAYRLKHGQFPQDLSVLTQQEEGGGAAMLEPKDLNDPWEQQYQYSPQQQSTTGKPKIFTVSPNGKTISNW